MPYLEKLGEMLQKEDRVIVYNYLMWRVVMELMPYLPLRYLLCTLYTTEHNSSMFIIQYRRKMKTEEKAKTAAWGAESIHFFVVFAALAILH